MKRKNAISAVLAVAMLTAAILPGCSSGGDSGVTEIEILQYKPEAATYFDQVEEQFNASHDDIHLTTIRTSSELEEISTTPTM